jgi:hypothetical protein
MAKYLFPYMITSSDQKHIKLMIVLDLFDKTLPYERMHICKTCRMLDFRKKVAKNKLSRFTISSCIQITAKIQPALLCLGLWLFLACPRLPTRPVERVQLA